MDDLELIALARQARERAYAPYSRFSVGAAVLAADGRVFTGCNVENASYGLTNCAERTAIFKAVSEGVRDLVAIAVVAETETPCSPCGACRQVISEFLGPQGRVIMANLRGAASMASVQDLLPGAFHCSDLPQKE